MKKYYWTIEVVLNDGTNSFVHVVAKNITEALAYIRKMGGDPDAVVYACGKEVDVVEG